MDPRPRSVIPRPSRGRPAGQQTPVRLPGPRGQVRPSGLPTPIAPMR